LDPLIKSQLLQFRMSVYRYFGARIFPIAFLARGVDRHNPRFVPRTNVQPPALLPRYAFVLIELQWHAARWSLGVVRLVLDGD
jgi:hypothetical protein